VLIAEAFDGEDDRFSEMQMVAAQLGLDVVLEVADEDELEHVLDLLDPDSFLIQNRRPGRHEADFEHTFSLLEEVPAGKVVLSEGGIRNRDQVLALESAGVDAAVLGDWVQRLGIARTLDVLRGDERE
jgi:indole-3-glycerol phosphate synthase